MGLGLLGTALAGAVKGAGNIADDEIKHARAAELEKARMDAEMKLRETLNGWEEGRFQQTFGLQKSTAEAEAADRAAQAKINQTRLEGEIAGRQDEKAYRQTTLEMAREAAGRPSTKDQSAAFDLGIRQELATADPNSPEGKALYERAVKIGVVKPPNADNKSFTESLNPDGTKSRIYGTPQSANADPAGMTWREAEARATEMAAEKAGLLSRDKTDFGPEGRQGYITRTAQELYQGKQGQPTIDQATIQGAMGNPDAMRKVLRTLNPGASEDEIDAAVADALKNSNSGLRQGTIRRNAGASGEY